jgi:hypothetical protein
MLRVVDQIYLVDVVEDAMAVWSQTKLPASKRMKYSRRQL